MTATRVVCSAAALAIVGLGALSGAAAADEPLALSTPRAAPQGGPAAPAGFDLVSVANGGQVVQMSSTAYSSQPDHRERQPGMPLGLIDGSDPGQTSWMTADAKLPQEIVLAFYGQQPALFGTVAINPQGLCCEPTRPKDVEIWVSDDRAESSFRKVATTTLPNQDGFWSVNFPPVEARFVKLRILSIHASANYIQLGKVKIIEASRPGYLPLSKRNPELDALVNGGPLDSIFPAGAPPASAPEPAGAPAGGGTDVNCEPTPPAQPPPAAFHESHKLLVISPEDYPSRIVNSGRGDLSIYQRLTTTTLRPAPKVATPGLLMPEDRFDTVVISQVCDIAESVPDAFKKALTAWVAQGHKLIIQDSDRCSSPDYSFLPYKFATSNPGRLGEPSNQLVFVEENAIASADPKDPAYLNVAAWIAKAESNANELGDSNVITKYDAHWCGHMFTINALHGSGFVEAYAHYGRGLIIYDGFDQDHSGSPEYDHLVTRELLLPFNPDGLSCSSRIGDFVVATEEKLKHQVVAQGQTYAYPLTLLANHGYKGAVKVSVASNPPDPSLKFRLDDETVQLTSVSKTKLAVTTTPETTREPHVLTVRGTDANGKSSTLCLAWTNVSEPPPPPPAQPPTAQSLKADLEREGHVALYINFDFDKATLKPDAQPTIEQVLKLLKDNPTLRLAINGHTDNVGTHDYNVKLSKARAATVVRTLVAAGIKANRLVSGGFGPDEPVAGNDTPEGRAKNRRVELVKL